MSLSTRDVAISIAMFPEAIRIFRQMGISNIYDVLVVLPTLLSSSSCNIPVEEIIKLIISGDIDTYESSNISMSDLEQALYELDNIGFFRENIRRYRASLCLYDVCSIRDYTYNKPYNKIIYHILETETNES